MKENADSPVWAWTRQSACVRHLEDARVVRVLGEDARGWLNGQTTNDIREVTEEAAVYALSLDAKGRIQADLWVVADGDGLAFVAPRAATEPLLEAMDRYIIMEDVELTPDVELEVVTVQGPKAADIAARAPQDVRRVATSRLGSGGFDLWVPRPALDETLAALASAAAQAGGGLADAEGWAAAHVHARVPRYGADFDARVYPQEAGLKEAAVSFNKGCYLGQEVVCMLENRGKLARRLVQLSGPEGALVENGAPVHSADGKRVGEITSVAPGPRPLALAFLKAAQADEGNQVRVEANDWTVGPAASVAG